MFWECGACDVRWRSDSRVCPSCLGPAERVPAPVSGTVVEHSEMDGRAFCVADFGGVRLICPVASGKPRPGASARLTGDGHDVDIVAPPDRRP